MNKINFNSFKLSNEVINAISKLGYEEPTEVQQKVIPYVLNDQDVIVKSQTGSGKTGSFAIPLCEKIKLEQREPQVLIITPTRELAVQIKEDVGNIGRYKRIRCAAIYGRQPIRIQESELKQRIHIIVGTPGRLIDHIERKNINLSKIEYLIIDEADEMLNKGFIDQVEKIINSLNTQRVTMLFSATMPEKIEEICTKHMISPIKIDIKAEKPTTEKIEQYYYEVEEAKKFNLLNQIIYTNAIESCIIFCNTRDKVEDIEYQMKRKNYYCIGLHGGMEQKERLETIKRFKSGEFHFLIATDVAARGIHIDDISHVINYDVPFEKESYVHRIGRTGRVDKEGVAITFVSDIEKRYLNEILRYINYKIPQKQPLTEKEVNNAKAEFDNCLKAKPKRKKNKADKINKEITKIRLNAGKDKKMRPGDIAGAVNSIKGINAEDVGIIDVQATCSYVEILNDKGEIVIQGLKNTKVKGRNVNIKIVKATV